MTQAARRNGEREVVGNFILQRSFTHSLRTAKRNAVRYDRVRPLWMWRENGTICACMTGIRHAGRLGRLPALKTGRIAEMPYFSRSDYLRRVSSNTPCSTNIFQNHHG